ncbi:MAG: hypothetical protein IT565_13660 [Rhodospirillales bacterium]|nr:hypothetical protein [Rhodospirillales bacterium]
MRAKVEDYRVVLAMIPTAIEQRAWRVALLFLVALPWVAILRRRAMENEGVDPPAASPFLYTLH